MTEAQIDDVRVQNQVTVFGFASNQTAELMPLPIQTAHRLSQRLAEVRRAGEVDFLVGDIQVAAEDDRLAALAELRQLLELAAGHVAVAQEHHQVRAPRLAGPHARVRPAVAPAAPEIEDDEAQTVIAELSSLIDRHGAEALAEDFLGNS